MSAARHPTFGEPRRLGAGPHCCSLCDAMIPEDTVPVMLFGSKPRPGEKDIDAWVYCEACEGVVLALAIPKH